MVGAGAAGFAAGAAVIAAGAGGTGRGVAGVEGVAATRAGGGGDVAVFPDELAVGGRCLTQGPADKQVRRRLARQTMVARDPRLAETSAAFGERLRELAGLLVVHDLRGGLPSALRER